MCCPDRCREASFPPGLAARRFPSCFPNAANAVLRGRRNSVSEQPAIESDLAAVAERWARDSIVRVKRRIKVGVENAAGLAGCLCAAEGNCFHAGNAETGFVVSSSKAPLESNVKETVRDKCPVVHCAEHAIGNSPFIESCP